MLVAADASLSEEEENLEDDWTNLQSVTFSAGQSVFFAAGRLRLVRAATLVACGVPRCITVNRNGFQC